MNNEILEHCKKEIENLLNKGLIRKSKSPWSYAAFYFIETIVHSCSLRGLV